MNFKYKAYLQNFFSMIPFGVTLNYLMQTKVTHSLPISDRDFMEKIETVKYHFENFKKYSSGIDVSECRYYEFGTGYDMVIPICMSLLGFNDLTCIDIRRLVFTDLINDSINRLNKVNDESLKLNKLKGIPAINKNNIARVLKEYMGISYLAPRDARDTKLKSSSIDFIVSNATMEHIPQNTIKDILKECYRILKPGGIMSNAIDYRDHWSFFDSSLSCYNYLQYSEKDWKKYNPGIMYQNRMRHRDYLEIIGETDFEIVMIKTDLPNQQEKNILNKLPLDEKFVKHYSPDELSIKSAAIVLRKNLKGDI